MTPGAVTSPGLRFYDNYGYVRENTKRIVWANVAISVINCASEWHGHSLRSRVGEEEDQVHNTEVYLNCTTFVRHAFGNLKDILFEVATPQ